MRRGAQSYGIGTLCDDWSIGNHATRLATVAFEIPNHVRRELDSQPICRVELDELLKQRRLGVKVKVPIL